MRTRIKVSLLCTAVGASLVFPTIAEAAPVAPAAERGPTCKRSGSRTVAQNRVVRVYKVKVIRSDDTVLYACRRSTGRRVRLATDFDDGAYSGARFGSVRLAGYYVAFAFSAYDDPGCKAACPPGVGEGANSQLIELYNVRRRRSRTVDGYPLGRTLVLSRHGGVAWASRSGEAGPVEIRASVRAGDNRVLDSGNIDARSLAIEITIISWTRDGLERFARLR